MLATCAALGGCDGSGTRGDYFPLDTGRHWQYAVTRTTMDGDAELRHAVSTIRLPASDATHTAARESLGGRRWYYAADDAGVFRVAERAPGAAGPEVLAQRQLVLPRHPELSSAWDGSTTTAALELTGPPFETLYRIAVPVPMRFRVASMTDTIETPAGRFDRCLRVVGEGRADTDVGNFIGDVSIEIDTEEWYAPGVGLVHMERTERTTSELLNHGRIEMTLDRWWRD